MQDNLIQINDSVIDVLKKLDKLPTTQTVFVIDADQKVVGVITDGDIRRALIQGYQLTDSLDKFCFKYFKCLVQYEDNFDRIKDFRKLKLKSVPLIDKEGRLVKVYDFSILKSILPVDAVIMAGGKGERLKPLTENMPKPLLKVGGKEIISYNFDRLFHYGIVNQHVTINYQSEKITEFCSLYNNEINFNMVQEKEFLGTAGALSLVNNFENDTILLMNSDLLTNIDYEDLYQTFKEKDADMMVASIPYQVNLPYAIFETNDREVISLKEKPNYTYYANAGIYLFKKEMLAYIPENKVFNATDFMDILVSNNHSLQHYPIRSYWLDIGKHEDFDKAQKDIAHINFD